MDRKRYFNKVAGSWDKRFNTPKLSSFLDELVPQFGLEKGQNILDVGTGTGVLIPYLIRAVGQDGSVTAVDYSEKMIQACRTKHPHPNNLYIKLGNIEESAFGTESYDIVICFGVFPHLENKEKTLRNINSSLKSGGKLIIAHALSSKELKEYHNNASFTVMHDFLLEKPEMKKLLEQTGFAETSIKDEPGCYLCKTHKT
jgi:demethylmenaquinone methyltransferase/2-methoxy-6-polyprenyl-1,4-benzoquinol methylase